MLLDNILNSLDKIPYGCRYIAHILLQISNPNQLLNHNNPQD